MLKALDVIGFKSFADKTRFDFSPGITGVVGPNGSGKSNVVDAVKWILGNQSAKSLRGKEMTDVIFNGANGRKGSGFAEATLTFDNSSGFLPVERQEVSIGRRIWNSGDSEYLINHQTARLKDIKDLLADSGIGVSAYCIIEQGRVAQILQSNPANRRTVFEEAAGISRFKGRKAEAERKLARVEQNLQRLTDIVDEVEARLNATRTQAAKAAKYRELSEELRELWQGLAADDARRLNARIADARQALEADQKQVQELNERQQRIELQLRQLDESISGIDDRLGELGRRTGQFRQRIATHQTTIRHQLARCGEMETDLVRLRRQQLIVSNRVRETQAEAERTRLVLAEQTRDFETLQLSMQQKQNTIETLIQAVKQNRAAAESQRRALLEGTREQAEIRARLDAIEGRLEQLDLNEQRRESNREALLAELERTEQALLEQNREVRQAGEKVARDESEVDQLVGARDRLREQRHELEQRIVRDREGRSAAQARKVVLEEIEQQAGIGLAEEEILDRSRTRENSPWNAIRGRVADFLDVDLEYAPLLDVALGARARLLLIDRIEPLAEYLARAATPIHGRVGFHSVSERSSSGDEREPSPDLADRPGVVMRADRMLKASSSDTRLAAALLGRTWVVETLQVALGLQGEEVGRDARFVTLQGELLESDGTLFAGTLQQEASLFSRRGELRRLKQELREFDRSIVESERALAELDERHRERETEIQSARETLQESRERLSEVRSEVLGSESRLSRLREQAEQFAQESERDRLAREELTGEMAAAEDRRDELGRELDQRQAEIAELERKELAAEEKMQTYDRQFASDKLELAKQEERVLNLNEAYRRMKADLESRRQQRIEADKRFERATKAKREIVLTVLNTEAELAELYLEEEDLALQSEALLMDKDEARLQRGRLNQQDAAIRGQRRTLDERVHQSEMRVRDLSYQLQSLEEKIQEEYQVVLADLVESGVSAIRAYAESPPTAPSDSSDPPEAGVEQAGALPPAPKGEPAGPADRELELPDGFDYDAIHDELESRVNRLRRKIKLMGSVDAESLADLDELQSRFTMLSMQLQDLVEARNSLGEIIRKINQESKRLFSQTFEAIRGHFQELFRKLFGGGEGDIILEDPNDILECGVDIVARPPGKELRSISLLSGGEKTMTAVALLMAIFKTRPSPFCILDEVDAALDEANIDRFIKVVKEFEDSTQFIIITHRKPTMTVCDVLYGVTMEQSGVSKRMSVKFDEVGDNGEFKTTGKQDSSAGNAA
jgi:chromosome segregation protein